jgi:hypothetical protein
MEEIKSISSPALLVKSSEELSETCSGLSCSIDGDDTNSRDSCSVAGDDFQSKDSVEGDDAVSLCSWTTDQGDDLDLSTELAAKCAWTGFGNCKVQDGMTSQYWQESQSGAMPISTEFWQEPVMWCYMVVPEDYYSHGKKSARKSKKGKNSAWYVPHTQGFVAPGNVVNPSVEAKASSKTNISADSSPQTTVILRNFPATYTREDLLRLLDDEGFSAAYDFVHLPIDFQKKHGLGYAVVNMVSHQMALSIWEHFTGFDRWDVSCDNVCEVAWNRPHQGLEAHIERYRNSPLMHESVPDVYRPALFDHGLRIAFAAPTARIRAPRVRHQKGEAASSDKQGQVDDNERCSCGNIYLEDSLFCRKCGVKRGEARAA